MKSANIQDGIVHHIHKTQQGFEKHEKHKQGSEELSKWIIKRMTPE